MSLCALKTLYLKHTHALTKTAAKITQACMHRVIQWLRAQYAQTKERKKSQDFLVICKRSDPVQNQWNCPISLWSISLTNLRRQGEVVVSAGDTEFGNWMYFVILLPFGWRSAVILSSTPPLYGVHFKTSSGSGFSIRPQMKRYKVSEKALSHSHSHLKNSDRTKRLEKKNLSRLNCLRIKITLNTSVTKLLHWMVLGKKWSHWMASGKKIVALNGIRTKVVTLERYQDKSCHTERYGK